MGAKKSKAIQNNYFPKGGYQVSPYRLDPIARVLLIGVYDDEHPMSKFRGMRYIIREIWHYVIQFNRHHFAPYIEIACGSTVYDGYRGKPSTPKLAFKEIGGPEFCSSIDVPSFPQPLKEEININMMPVKMDLSLFGKQLPQNLHGYIPLLTTAMRCDYGNGLSGKICFLTIHESFVKKGRTQRRPGLHVECPGSRGAVNGEAQFTYIWGDGFMQQDGIYMASNIGNSCAVWSCRINEVDGQQSAIDRLGNIEYLRNVLNEETKYLMKAGQLYWITDRTPHEALPMQQDGWRQFFRLVSSKLSVWYEQHSTKNPAGIVPDPEITTIIKANKFDKK